ncbi:hypothetical protein NDU88_003053 [Pleurodeles waltl]|uniref:Uncharacterized protein n=1 Tax=Pleurodeles waltl TaxID=8319 RepID=A0AAV7MUJ2_PLEWA|nr:hypothetical protein NDU88_003053 [Pleurodeles waltl]
MRRVTEELDGCEDDLPLLLMSVGGALAQRDATEESLEVLPLVISGQAGAPRLVVASKLRMQGSQLFTLEARRGRAGTVSYEGHQESAGRAGTRISMGPDYKRHKLWKAIDSVF